MPYYQFGCRQCSWEGWIRRPIQDADDLLRCRECGGVLDRQFKPSFALGIRSSYLDDLHPSAYTGEFRGISVHNSGGVGFRVGAGHHVLIDGYSVTDTDVAIEFDPGASADVRNATHDPGSRRRRRRR